MLSLSGAVADSVDIIHRIAKPSAKSFAMALLVWNTVDMTQQALELMVTSLEKSFFSRKWAK